MNKIAPKYPNEKEKGFTLIELMMSMVVFLIAIAAIFGVLQLATLQNNTINTRTDALKGAKIALEYIRKDAINAGLGYNIVGGVAPDNFAKPLLNIPSDADTERDFLTGIMAGNSVYAKQTSGAVQTDTVAFVSRDFDFNSGNLIKFSRTIVSGDNIDIQTSQSIKDIAKPYDLYLLEFGSGTSQVVGMATDIPDNNNIQLAPGDPLGVNLSANESGDLQSLLVAPGGKVLSGTIKKINLVSFYVTDDGILVRKSYGNQSGKGAGNQIETRELIYGVKDFQVTYLLDDGTTTDDPSNGNDGQSNQKRMNKVVEIEISITVTQDDTGLPQASEPITFKETISTRNLRYTAG